MAKPELEGCLTKVSGGCSEGGEVGGSGTEFVPREARGVACDAHGLSLPEDRPVEALSTAVMRRCIGGSSLVIDTV